MSGRPKKDGIYEVRDALEEAKDIPIPNITRIAPYNIHNFSIVIPNTKYSLMFNVDSLI